jgi:hypothetical protein
MLHLDFKDTQPYIASESVQPMPPFTKLDFVKAPVGCSNANLLICTGPGDTWTAPSQSLLAAPFPPPSSKAGQISLGHGAIPGAGIPRFQKGDGIDGIPDPPRLCRHGSFSPLPPWPRDRRSGLSEENTGIKKRRPRGLSTDDCHHPNCFLSPRKATRRRRLSSWESYFEAISGKLTGEKWTPLPNLLHCKPNFWKNFFRW